MRELIPDGDERLSADDLATSRQELFLAAALNRQRRAAAMPAMAPGRCANCDEPCLPQAVFCDGDCRGDFEQRQRVLARQGRSA